MGMTSCLFCQLQGVGSSSSKEGASPRLLNPFPKPGNNWDPHEGSLFAVPWGWVGQGTLTPDTSGRGEREEPAGPHFHPGESGPGWE